MICFWFLFISSKYKPSIYDPVIKTEFWELYDFTYDNISLYQFSKLLTFQEISSTFISQLNDTLEEYKYLFQKDFLYPDFTINQILDNYSLANDIKNTERWRNYYKHHQINLPLGTPNNIRTNINPWLRKLWLVPQMEITIPKENITKGSEQISNLYNLIYKYLSKGLVRNLVKYFGNYTLGETIEYFGSKNKQDYYNIYNDLRNFETQEFSLEWTANILKSSYNIIYDIANNFLDTYHSKIFASDICRLLLGKEFNSTSVAELNSFFKVASDNHTFFSDREFYEMSALLEAKEANIRVLQMGDITYKQMHKTRPKIEIVNRTTRTRRPARTPLPIHLPAEYYNPDDWPRPLSLKIDLQPKIAKPKFDIEINNISRSLSNSINNFKTNSNFILRPILQNNSTQENNTIFNTNNYNYNNNYYFPNRYTPFYDYWRYRYNYPIFDRPEEEPTREQMKKKYSIAKEFHWQYNRKKMDQYYFNGTSSPTFIEGSDKSMADIIRNRKSKSSEITPGISDEETLRLKIKNLQESYNTDWVDVNRERVYRALRVISNSSITDKISALMEEIATESFVSGLKRAFASMDENETVFETLKVFFDSKYLQNICDVLINITNQEDVKPGEHLFDLQRALGESVLPNLTNFIKTGIPENKDQLLQDFEFKENVKTQFVIDDYNQRFSSLVGIGSSLIASGTFSIPFVTKQILNISTNDVLLLLDGITETLAPYISNHWFGAELIENLTTIRTFIFKNQRNLKAPFIAEAMPFPKLSLNVFKMWIRPKTTIDLLLRTLDEKLQIDKLCLSLMKKPMMRLFDVFTNYKKEHRFLGFAKGILDYFYRATVLVMSETVSPYELVAYELSPKIISLIRDFGKMSLYDVFSCIVEKDVLNEVIRVARHAAN